jgi:hypothetical protein
MHCVRVIKRKGTLITESAGCVVVCCSGNATKMAVHVNKCSVAHKYSVACLYIVKEFYFFSLYQFSFDKLEKPTSKTLLLVVF